MRIEWVNHASFVLDSGGVRMISDPWIEGRAFDDGWAHLSPTRFRYEDFDGLTHLWFSHEHPDHFSPANLRKIPEAARRRIVVLYQRTRDRKVVKFCEKAGFADVVELPTASWFRVGPGFDVLCRPLDNGDSWLAVRTPEATLLNLNDCIVRDEAQCRAIGGLVGGGDVDVLLTQFSYASWAGNPGDRGTHRRHAAEKLDRVRLQTTSLRPRHVVPFASHVWFCHEENYFHNDGINRVDDAHACIAAAGARSLVLYPGETWDVGAPHNSTASIARYRPDYERVFASPALATSPAVDVGTLRGRADEFVRRIFRRNGALFRLARRRNPFAPARIHVADHDVALEFSLERGLVPAAASGPCDIVLSSSALSYCFEHEWGGGTLQVNGRFRAPADGDVARFHLYFELAEANNRGVTFPSLLAKRLLGRFSGA